MTGPPGASYPSMHPLAGELRTAPGLQGVPSPQGVQQAARQGEARSHIEAPMVDRTQPHQAPHTKTLQAGPQFLPCTFPAFPCHPLLIFLPRIQPPLAVSHDRWPLQGRREACTEQGSLQIHFLTSPAASPFRLARFTLWPALKAVPPRQRAGALPPSSVSPAHGRLCVTSQEGHLLPTAAAIEKSQLPQGGPPPTWLGSRA